MDRRTFLAALGTGATAALAGCGTSLADSDYDVEMTANRFRPAEITVSVGETVTWGNPGSRGHSVTAYGGQIPEDADYWASGGLGSESDARARYPQEGHVASGETYSHTFEVAGDHEYFCIPHERGGMVGTVVVEE
ncbi:plastocyanin/azurin family copper-binding protein [Halosegnis marinus]|uniref:Plastocyanin/azurin family copper-binding protein n=1 Tax=Halosegnis marinus TaxID=3034023 RepID=A0ABD5ZRU2_9EURY|nr:plastocyanin/azurin family copper-binding protein [Halosegnis sp. DT85]